MDVGGHHEETQICNCFFCPIDSSRKRQCVVISSWRSLAWTPTLAYACKRLHQRAAWCSNVLRFILLPACSSSSFTADRLYRTESGAASRHTTSFDNAPAKQLVVLLPLPLRLLSLREILHAALAACRTETTCFTAVTSCRYAAPSQSRYYSCWREDALPPRHMSRVCSSFPAQAKASNNSTLTTTSASSSPANSLADRRPTWRQQTAVCAA